MKVKSMIDLLILSVLSDSKKNTYEIKQEIDSSFSLFLRTSFGSLHPALKKLENYGCVAVKNKLSSGGHRKSVYSITDKGKGYFEHLMLKELPNNPQTANHMINIKLMLLLKQNGARLSKESREKIIKSIIRYLESCANSSREFLKENEDAEGMTCKFIKHNLVKITEDIKWLNSLL